MTWPEAFSIAAVVWAVAYVGASFVRALGEAEKVRTYGNAVDFGNGEQRHDIASCDHCKKLSKELDDIFEGKT